jgi:integrase
MQVLPGFPYPPRITLLILEREMRIGKWLKRYEKLIEMRDIKASTTAEKLRLARELVAMLGNRKLAKVRPYHLIRTARKLQPETPAKARRMVSVARDFFGEAVANGYLHHNPAIAIKLPACKVRRERLPLKEWRATQAVLAQDAAPWRKLLAPLALVTGQRRSDLVKMKFTDVRGKYLYIEQAKTGERIALPLALRLKAVGLSLGEIIESCRAYQPEGETLLRKSTGAALSASMLTKAWRMAFVRAVGNRPDAPSLAEIRSLSARLYHAEKLDTQTLLGHKKATTTALYHDSRGLKEEWRHLRIS